MRTDFSSVCQTLSMSLCLLCYYFSMTGIKIWMIPGSRMVTTNGHDGLIGEILLIRMIAARHFRC